MPYLRISDLDAGMREKKKLKISYILITSFVLLQMLFVGIDNEFENCVCNDETKVVCIIPTINVLEFIHGLLRRLEKFYNL